MRPPVYYSWVWTVWWCCWSFQTCAHLGVPSSDSEKSPEINTSFYRFLTRASQDSPRQIKKSLLHPKMSLWNTSIVTVSIISLKKFFFLYLMNFYQCQGDMFLPQCVSLSLMKFIGNVDNGSRNRGLHFAGDQDHHPSPGIFNGLLLHLLAISDLLGLVKASGIQLL